MPETIIRSLCPMQILRSGRATRIIERAVQGPPDPRLALDDARIVALREIDQG